ncbi:MAG: radical SAM protein [Myxococcota bacterium]
MNPHGDTPTRSRSPDGRDVATDAEARLTLDAVLSWRTAHEELSEELQENAYIALRAMLSDDLYPHVVGLGETLDEAQILDAWSDTKQFMKEGRAPQKLCLYCHIPYCTVECTFCYCGKTEDFVRSDVDQYVDKLGMEADLFAERVDGMPFTSVYFGGGTPSLLTPPAMRRLFQHFYSQFHVPEGTQVVFEGNPDSLKPNKVDILAGEGRVTRLTIGIQTLDPDVQKHVRRYNKHEDVEAALGRPFRGNSPHQLRLYRWSRRPVYGELSA